MAAEAHENNGTAEGEECLGVLRHAEYNPDHGENHNQRGCVFFSQMPHGIFCIISDFIGERAREFLPLIECKRLRAFAGKRQFFQDAGYAGLGYF